MKKIETKNYRKIKTMWSYKWKIWKKNLKKKIKKKINFAKNVEKYDDKKLKNKHKCN